MLCRKLDEYLNNIVGGEKQRTEYIQYNTLAAIHDVVLIIYKEEIIGCGSFKHYNDTIAEIKRVLVCEPYRGYKYGFTIMTELERLAKEKGYKKLVLETGKPLKSAMKLYKGLGYKIIKNYGPYINMSDSICMEKILIKY